MRRDSWASMAAMTVCVALAMSSSSVRAFAPQVPLSRAASTSPLFRLQAAAVSPFAKLPWNVQIEKERQARKLSLERSSLHRQLGIAEDASYEEIVEATDLLIEQAGSNLKQKIKIEVAKDKILQIRLNERLAGLSNASMEARAQSKYEREGSEEDGMKSNKPQTGDTSILPKWSQGLIVKPNAEHIRKQARLWGAIATLGVALPPAQGYIARFSWLICVGQLQYRGLPPSLRGSGGMMSFEARGVGGGHRGLSFGLGIATLIFSTLLVNSLMPSWAKGQRWSSTLSFVVQNFIYGVVCSYLQPYKGGGGASSDDD